MEKLNEDPNGISTPSEFDVNYVHLYTYRSSAPIDISKMVNYIEIFESIYSPFLTININISDNQSLTNALPLKGEEFVEIDIRGADGTTGITKQQFYIYKLSDRVAASDKTFVYTLNCISPSAIFDMNMKISQFLRGQPSTIVEENLCKTGMAVTKQVFSYPTKHEVSYISNYWSPVKNIKYLCERAVSADTGASNYMFFETIKGFHFVPLEALVDAPSTFDYYYSINNQTGSIQDQQQIIHNLYVDQTFNYIERIMNGAYGNRALFVDGTTKSYKYAYYDFLEAFEKRKRLNPAPFSSDDATRRTNAVFRTRDVPTMSARLMPDEMSSDWYQQRLTELAGINAQSLCIDVIGRFNTSVGSVVNILIPTTTPTVEDRPDAIIDSSMSGRYLITSIKHMLTRERHTMHIQASKDSMIKLSSGNA